VPQFDQEPQERMKEVLEVPNQQRDEHAPVVALDERAARLLDSLRPAPSGTTMPIRMRLLTVEVRLSELPRT